MKAYLSIDLDYWCQRGEPHHVRAFFQRVWKLNLPITVALHHHHLLESINRRRGLDTIINVDYHSDVAEDARGFTCDLNEGTWGNFVDFQSKGTFIWRYPNEVCLSHDTGYCHTYLNPFEEQCTGWRSIKKKQGLARIPWHDICAVGVCLSPCWLERPWVMSYPIETLGMVEWMGRWMIYCNNCNGSMANENRSAENGTGKYKPRLTRPKYKV